MKQMEKFIVQIENTNQHSKKFQKSSKRKDSQRKKKQEKKESVMMEIYIMNHFHFD